MDSKLIHRQRKVHKTKAEWEAAQRRNAEIYHEKELELAEVKRGLNEQFKIAKRRKILVTAIAVIAGIISAASPTLLWLRGMFVEHNNPNMTDWFYWFSGIVFLAWQTCLIYYSWKMCMYVFCEPPIKGYKRKALDFLRGRDDCFLPAYKYWLLVLGLGIPVILLGLSFNFPKFWETLMYISIPFIVFGNLRNIRF